MLSDSSAQERYRVLLDALDAGVGVVERLPPGPDGQRYYRFIEMNAAMQALLGVPDASARSIQDIFPDEFAAWCEACDQVMEAGVAKRFARWSPALDMDIDLFVAPFGDPDLHQLVTTVRDTDARWQADQSLRDRGANLTSAQFNGGSGRPDIDLPHFLTRQSPVEPTPEKPINDSPQELGENTSVPRHGGHNRAEKATFTARGPRWKSVSRRRGLFLRHNDVWADVQNAAFQATMNGADLDMSLGIIARAAAAWMGEDCRCAFYLADRENSTLHHVAGMADSYAHAVNGFPIALDSIGCGLAIASGNPVVTYDVLQEPRWKSWQGLAQEHGFRGHWCFPVETEAGRIVGSFAMYFREPCKPNQHHFELAASLTRTAAIIVSRHQAETALRESERHLRVLVAELQHRVRNILTVVRSVFSRTAATNDDYDQLVRHFEGRLNALARTHVSATRRPEGTAAFEDLVRDELLSAGISDGPKLRIEGPEVELEGRTAETMALALHELTTNSIKYGALSHARGCVEIVWNINLNQSGRRCLDLHWNERGVPAVATSPSRKGFGRQLIEEVLPYQLAADAKLEFHGGGVRCSISLPL